MSTKRQKGFLIKGLAVVLVQHCVVRLRCDSRSFLGTMSLCFISPPLVCATFFSVQEIMCTSLLLQNFCRPILKTHCFVLRADYCMLSYFLTHFSTVSDYKLWCEQNMAIAVYLLRGCLSLFSIILSNTPYQQGCSGEKERWVN